MISLYLYCQVALIDMQHDLLGLGHDVTLTLDQQLNLTFQGQLMDMGSGLEYPVL